MVMESNMAETGPVFDELYEGIDLEVKKASGRDGKGEVPKSVYETYSSMANTYGGVIYLGVEELTDKSLSVVGIEDSRKVLKQFWDTLNNAEKVSRCILVDEDATIKTYDGKDFIRIKIPRASRQERPIYLGRNPFTGTYKRNHEGDYKLNEESVKRMLAEQVENTRDGQILHGFNLNDLISDSVKAYRNRFSSLKPDHVWNSLGNDSFLNRIGVIKTDRETERSGLTGAGLLMFGEFSAISEVYPNYMLDYQERDEAAAVRRWVDRITLDGTWSGNIFDFYTKVIAKLYSGISVPFTKDGHREDNTPIHHALREALVNTLIHADYSERASILVVKRPDLFGFRNPGLMRVSKEDAIHGGTSDCRNRVLQRMFTLLNLGEQAGSGVPAIYRNWSHQHWRAPELWERQNPDQTLMSLPMVSLIPDEVLEALREKFGKDFDALSSLQRLALATAYIEGQVSHGRLRVMSTDHPHDITSSLAYLVRVGFLNSSGATRGTTYYLPDAGDGDLGSARLNLDFSSYPSLEPRDMFKVKLSQGLPAMAESAASSVEDQKISELAAEVFASRKAAREVVSQTIVDICRVRPLSIKEIAKFTNRKAETLRNHYIPELIREGALRLQFPGNPRHPEQAYISVREED